MLKKLAETKTEKKLSSHHQAAKGKLTTSRIRRWGKAKENTELWSNGNLKGKAGKQEWQ